VTAALMSEAELLDAARIPRLVMRDVPCACGGRLSAPQGDDGALVAAVVRHNETPAHRGWRRRQADA
jgi:hypothetical protein